MILNMGQEDIIRNNYVASSFSPPEFVHSHDFFELSFCIHGKIMNVINGIAFPFERGKCVIIRPKDKHFFKPYGTTAKSGANYEHKDVYVKESDFIRICDCISPELYKELTEEPSPVIFDINEDFFTYIYNRTLLLAEAMILKNEHFTAIHTAIVTAILNQWLETRIFSKQVYPKWLSDLLPNFNSADFLSKTITEISDEIGYSLPYFSSEFKKYMGISAVKYLIKKRCAFAKQLLIENSMKIIDISLLLGFANPSTFSKHFHEEYGVTPREYKKKS